MQARRAWDVFCRVIDNHGDLGVAWRLCADLAGRGESVRLWVDDASALAWMAPSGHPGVKLIDWTDPGPDLEPGEVVVEAFGCEPPPRFVERMAASTPPPVWIDLEYLSAEAYVERSHGLSSPVNVGEGRMLVRHFFFPGFTGRTGGLLREPDLLAAQQSFDRSAWLSAAGILPRTGERLASLFCYDNPALAALLDRLAEGPTLLLVPPGAPAELVRTLLGPRLERAALRAQLLPYLTQPGYDRLLWAGDINFVRGEDSFVRAQWTGKPFVWQIYPQQDGAHAAKLHAFLDRMLEGADASLAVQVRALFLAWNSLAPMPPALPEFEPWQRLCEAWRERLLANADLSSQLLQFARKVAKIQGFA